MYMCVHLCVSSPDNEGSIEACIAFGYDLVGSRRGKRQRDTQWSSDTDMGGGGGQKTFSISIQLNSFCLCHKAKASCCYCFSENTVLYNSDHIYYEGSFLCGSEVSNLKQIETTDLFLISINK